MSFPVGTVFWGHSLTLKAPVSGSISQREKSVSRSPLLSIFRYPVTPGGMEEDGCVLTGWKFIGSHTSSLSVDLLIFCLAFQICVYLYIYME